MKTKFILIAAVCALAITACNKKQKEEVTTPVPSTQETVRQESVTPKQETKPEETQPQTPESKTDKPSTPAPQTLVYKPQHTTAWGKGTVSVTYHQININCPVVISYIADSIIVASAQPLLGIEMYRLEARKDYVRLYEKANRRYVEMTYDEISTEVHRKVDFLLAEQMVEEVGLVYPIGKDTTISYSGVTAKLTLLQRTVDKPVSAAPISNKGYSKTTIKALLSK